MSLFSIFERIMFRDTENERYDPRKANRNMTGRYIRQIRKELKNQTDTTPYKTYLYGNFDMGKICDYFFQRGYNIVTDGKHELIISKELEQVSHDEIEGYGFDLVNKDRGS